MSLASGLKDSLNSSPQQQERFTEEDSNLSAEEEDETSAAAQGVGDSEDGESNAKN